MARIEPEHLGVGDRAHPDLRLIVDEIGVGPHKLDSQRFLGDERPGLY